ncbi:sodium calcium exchanger 3-like [Brachionus plicatilis]|uniref:Sodium calcium exchanger 3-like n=1 Tax=Brachionus plicatilis TaxID=10195 RepID=A0A3M7SDG3_BRAPC|nr:sodium calcium exchanger 3-like [Brachionus plicatilis]
MLDSIQRLIFESIDLNFSYESAEKIIKAINKLNANANLFTEAQKLKMIAHYSNLLKNHPFTFYKIKAIQMLTGSSVGSFAIKNELKIYLKENNELFGINDNEHGLDLAKNCFSSECQTDSSVIVEFSACVMAVNPAENYFLVTITRSRNIEIQVYFMLRTSNGSLHSFKHYKPLNNLIFKFEASEFEKKIPIYWIPNSNYKNGDQFYLHLDIHQESSKIARLGPVPNCIISTITNESSSAEIEFLDVMYLLDSFNESLVVKLVRNFRTSGSIAIGFRIFINDIEIDFLNFAFFEVQFLNGEKEKLVKIGGKSLPEIASGKFSLKIFIKKSDFDCRIGQRNEAIIFVQINKEIGFTKTNLLSENKRKKNKKKQNLILIAENYLKKFDRERKLNKILDAIKAENSIDAKKLSLMDQFVQALSVNNGDLNNSNFNDYFLHLIFLPWKILFSFVPPVDILNGWLTLLISTLISSILIRSIVHESILFGCLIGVDSTTTFFILIPLALGIPAKDYENSYLIMLARISVSVLFGLGFPWSLVAVFSKIKVIPTFTSFSVKITKNIVTLMRLSTIFFFWLSKPYLEQIFRWRQTIFKGIRGEKRRSAKQFTRISQREHFLSNRVVDNWNLLDDLHAFSHQDIDLIYTKSQELNTRQNTSNTIMKEHKV